MDGTLKHRAVYLGDSQTPQVCGSYELQQGDNPCKEPPSCLVCLKCWNVTFNQTADTIWLVFFFKKSENRTWKKSFRSGELKSLEKHIPDFTDNCCTYACVLMNNGTYYYDCPVWDTLITVWRVDGGEAAAVMTAPLGQQLSLPRWKCLESAVKNASEIYRAAAGLRIIGGETYMVPSGRGPSRSLCGEITAEHNGGTMRRQRRLCFLFPSLLRRCTVHQHVFQAPSRARLLPLT